jgi:hypothetical protein
LQKQIAYQAVYYQRGQRGKINHEPCKLETRKNSGKRAHESRRHAIDPGHKRSADIDREKLEDETEREQKLDDSEKDIY